MLTFVGDAAGDSLGVPTAKWSTWYRFQTALGYPHIAFALPEPIRGATLGLLAWFRTPEGLYTPGVKLLNGTTGSQVAEYWGLPAIFPEKVDVVDANRDGHLRELIVSEFGGALSFDLDAGTVLWQWQSPEILAGPSAVFEGATSLLVSVTWLDGTLYGVAASNGTLEWSVQGIGNSTQLTAPLVVEVGGHSGVVAAHPALVNGTGAVVVPPELRLVDLVTRQVRWRLALRHNATVLPVLVSSGSGQDPDVVFLDWEMTFPNDRRAFAVSAPNGTLKWDVSSADLIVSSPSLTPVKTNAGPWVLSSSWSGGNTSFLALNATSGAARQVATSCKGDATQIVPVDLTDDGLDEVLMSTSGGQLCAFSLPRLDLLWSQTFRNAYIGTPALGDIDGDGAPEFVTFSQEGYVDAFDLPATAPHPPAPGFDVIVVLVGVIPVVLVVAAIWTVLGRGRRNTAKGLKGKKGTEGTPP
jgi:outer membrane protein assembly factor BamB